MSPDDIFAANMWIWPDPLLKRDASGRIIFVNAAFLQLYGGRIENWAGHPVQGWPAPAAYGAPYRFETRIPSENGETIYDWVEVTMSDGNALAIARDVSIFLTPPNNGLPVEPVAVAPQAPQNTAPPQSAPAFAAAPAAPAFASAEIQAPEPEAPSPEPVFTAEPVEAPAPAAHAPQTAAPVAPAAPVAFEAPVAPQSEPAVAPPLPAQVEAPAAQDENYVEPERDFERRALPIEDGDAVLGSNWRDAVIARAVGAETVEPEPVANITAAVHGAEQDQPVEQKSAGLKILLAEDNAINALLTRTLLEAEGCTVETVEDGVLAVKAMENNMYDLIFMDMRMPNMDGLEATRKIRAMGQRTADLPIIALTANAFDDDRNACFDSGMNDFMTKPVSAEELTQMVESWTNNIKEKKSVA